MKRKRGTPIDQQSSTEADSSRSESDISESASDAKLQSPGEEPPTKRKREKALKTASERARRLCRVKGQQSPLGPKNKPLVDNTPTSLDKPAAKESCVLPDGGKEEAENVSECPDAAKETENQEGGRVVVAKEKETSDVVTTVEIAKVHLSTGEESTLSNESAASAVDGEAAKPVVERNNARKKTSKQGKRSRRKGRPEEKENAAEKKVEAKAAAGEKRRKKRGLRPTACQEGDVEYEPNNKLVRPETQERDHGKSKASGQDSVCISEDDIPLIELRRSTRSNKGQRKFEPLLVHEPKKRRKKDDLQEEKNRKKLELEEKRLKREAELAAKNRKVVEREFHC